MIKGFSGTDKLRILCLHGYLQNAQVCQPFLLVDADYIAYKTFDLR